ncbi:MAG TPA: DUF87 domain-containing protein [Terriglobia bacterium]|nr:DUF87 domain-containing protein [Terriglobia bacterium]
MKKELWLAEKIFGNSLAEKTREHLADLASRQTRASRERATALLRQFHAEPGSKVVLGTTEWREPVEVPLQYLVEAHSIITGGTGSGKTMAALLLIDALLSVPDPRCSFGVLDAKGELFERTLYLVARKLETLPAPDAERLRNRIVIVDLSSQDVLSSYNIASPWSGSDLDFFATSRLGTFQELLPAGDSLTLRGSAIVKHVLMLLAEHRLPFSYVDRVIASEPLRMKLLAKSKEQDLRDYFRFHFPNEGRATISAVRGRIASALLSSLSLKLALSGNHAPDLRAIQDEGKICLINCAGPNISRTTARTLQALFISDIRQSVFARKAKTRPYVWVCDEAQHCYRTRQLRENMTELLTMSRSFGSFFLSLTQNLTTAVQDGETLETIHTNIRWSLTLPGSSKDGAFLQPAFPVTGRMPKPRLNPYAPVEFYSVSEERSQLLAGLASLPPRTGWLWLKSKSGEAIKIQTHALDLPEGDAFSEAVDRIRQDSSIGYRLSRAAFLEQIAKRDELYLKDDEPELAEKLKQSYRKAEDIA